ncbi:hypothetical protein AB0399_01765 [Streptomyces sp. NPDC088194]|uniref:hypothetical protein n=1 Tax=Streptomyces sp. NPDC088194 TaxID=3154931 RepID=UPI00344D79B1
MTTGDETGREPATSGLGPSVRPTTGCRPPVGVPSSAAAGLVFDDPLDRPAADDTDRGWGDSPSGGADDDFTRFLNEKPPHHI